ncbi:SagB/ThcOx family dehydrogenase [Streptomyces sp. NBC_01142]|uniref:SagB family peptide dehydrogenase n=1 Tax=Streptomyces sp. NBC_01142 TaxID=2975865 RepID=UPI0022518861|nr:SagB family peptide dehydrogenase [Streptomyces sp. NBC_01142]MCX4820789.1 SagB/ThcOx family dehydrogenase [Streptomyces sp. NBC_01142]
MRLRVSRLTVFTCRNGQLVCDDPVNHRQFALRPAVWGLLPHYSAWSEPREGDADLVKQLLAAGLLIEEGSPEHRREDELGTWRTWGTAATYFHLASRTHDGERFVSAAEDTVRLRQKGEQEPQPEPFKRYPSPAIPLPDPAPLPMDLAQALRRRRTTRRFAADEPVSLIQLSTMLHWAAGVQHQVDLPGFGVSLLKASPSGGSRHPVEIYPVVRDVAGVRPGIYHYAPDIHALEPLPVDAPTDEEILHWCGDQSFVARAPVLFMYSAVLERSSWKYPMSRTYRALFADLGHVSQTAYLTGTALGLGVFFTAAIRDETVEKVLDLDWNVEIPMGVTGFGVPDPEEAERQAGMLEGGEIAFSYPRDEWDGLG